MILIAESGSTKTDWLIYEKDKLIDRCASIGLNPYFVSKKDIYQELMSIQQLQKIRDEVSHVYFFGSGCSAPHLNQRIASGLEQVFIESSISVDHDLIAAAYATFDGRPAISCIIGTGSNSCFFDGKNIREEVPSLAYILGDEGSGAYFGKKLLAAFFYKQLPADLHQVFREWYPDLDKDKMTEQLYNRPRPNVFLASFMPFVLKHQNNSILKDWIEKGFQLFIKNQILCYPEAKEVPIHFVGSIAKKLKEPLQHCLEGKGLYMGKVIARPAEYLAEYVIHHIHRNNP